MSSKTKIVVLHMKELIYTGILAALGILIVILLIALFAPGSKEASSYGETDDPATDDVTVPTSSESIYIPGVYTTELVLGGQTVDVEVILSEDTIDSISLVNLTDAVTTMYPLLQPTFDALYEQVLSNQSLENITYSTESKYTSLVLLEAIRNSIEKGTR